MSVPVVYLEEAEDEIAIATTTYEQQQAGLGVRFAEGVRDQVAVICKRSSQEPADVSLRS